MTRVSQASPLLRMTAVAAVALAMLPLSGCVYAQIPTTDPSGEGPAPSPGASAPGTPSDEPSDAPAGDLPSTLTFADGAALPSTAYIQWGDGLLTDEGWKTVSPDDGNGGWTYGTVDDTCTARFWQGLIPDVPTVPGDDSASSDSMLAVILGETDVAAISTAATTSAFSYQIGGNADVENRRLLGEDGSDRRWIMAARAFTTTGVGLYVIVDCTGGDVEAVMAEVVEKNAVIVQ